MTGSKSLEQAGEVRRTFFEKLASFSRAKSKLISIVTISIFWSVYAVLELTATEPRGAFRQSTYFLIEMSIWFAVGSGISALLLRKLNEPGKSIATNAPWGALESLARARTLQSTRARLFANIFSVVDFIFLISMCWISATVFFVFAVMLVRKVF